MMLLAALLLMQVSDPAETLLTAPFAAARANFFGATVEVPPLESARTLPAGSLYLRVRASAARSNHDEGHITLRQDNFDGTYEEFATIQATWAPADGLELWARTVVAGWDEQQDRFALWSDAGDPIVRNEDAKLLSFGATRRHTNVSVIGFGAKRQWVRDGVDFSTTLSVKIPVGRELDVTHSGTTDVAVAGLVSAPVPWGLLHAQLGFTVPFGNQTIFEPREQIDANPFAFAAVGTTWRGSDSFALGIQLEANTSAWRDVDFLAGTAVDLVVGARGIVGPWVFEAFGGGGLDWSSSYQWMGGASVGRLF